MHSLKTFYKIFFLIVLNNLIVIGCLFCVLYTCIFVTVYLGISITLVALIVIVPFVYMLFECKYASNREYWRYWFRKQCKLRCRSL